MKNSQKREEQVDLGAIAREIQREEAKEEAKKVDLDKFEGDEGEIKQMPTKSGVDSDSDDEKEEKQGTSKQRRKALRDEKDSKGTNYYTKVDYYLK